MTATVPAAEPLDNARHWIWLGPDRPTLIRIRVSFAGQPYLKAFQQAQQAYAQSLFLYLDRDSDARLNEAEALRAPPPQLQLTGGGGLSADVHFAFNFRALDANGDGSLAPHELTNYLLAYSDGPLRFEQGPPSSLPENGGLWTHLNTNGDDWLSFEELRAAESLLERLDVNDDELLSPAEVRPGGDYVAIPEELQNTATKRSRLVAVDSARKAAALLLEAYGGQTGREELSNELLHLSTAVFAELDQNQDGMLSQTELAGYLTSPADFELFVDLMGHPSLVFVPAADGRQPKHFLSQRPIEDCSFRLDHGRMSIHVAAAPEGIKLCHESLARELRNQDANEDGVIDRHESRGPLIRNMTKLIDADGNGAIDAAEIDAYLTFIPYYLIVTARRSAFWLSSPAGGIFDSLDTNRDGALSRSELRTAEPLGRDWDIDQNGHIERAEVKGGLLLSVGVAQAGPRATAIDPMLGAEMLELLKADTPRWFEKMDANRDRTISPREFLGERRHFDALDTDGDQLISPQEARMAAVD